MNSSKYLVLGLLILVALGKEAWKEKNGVVLLNDKNFEEFIASHPYTFIKFFRPSCPHCQRIEGTFSNAAKNMKKSNGKWVAAEMDVSTSPLIQSRYEVWGVPALGAIIKGNFIKHEGERRERIWLQFLNKQENFKLPELETLEEVNKTIDIARRERVQLFYIGKKTDADYEIFETIARNNMERQMKFYVVTTDDKEGLQKLLNYEGTMKNGIVTLIKDFPNETKATLFFDKKLTNQIFQSFINNNKIPDSHFLFHASAGAQTNK